MTEQDLDGPLGLEELYERATENGCEAVAVEPMGLAPGSDDEYWAKATLTKDGRTVTLPGFAKAGDSQSADGREPLSDEVYTPQKRACNRALRKALSLVLGKQFGRAQEPHVVRIQATVRETAQALGVDRDTVALMVHEQFGVASCNEIAMEDTSAVIGFLAGVRRTAGVAA